MKRATFALLLTLGCGSGDPGDPSAPAPTGASVRRPAPGIDLAGPIAPPVRTPRVARGPVAPLDLLADRAIVRVAVPTPPRGGAVPFTFADERTGWVARIPEDNALPAVAYGGDRVFVSGGFRSVTFYGLDATTGHIDWATTNLEDNGPTAAVYDDGRVLFNTESCTLFALDARTGKRLWLRKLGDPTLSQTAVAGGLVFAAHPADTGHQLSAFRVDTGDRLWSRWVGSELLAAPVAFGDAIYASTLAGWTFAFRLRDGAPLWRKPLHATTAPWPAGDQLFVTRRVASREQQIVVSAATGDILHEHDTSPGAYAWDVPGTGADLLAIWQFEGSRPVIDRGIRYIALGGDIRASDASTGAPLWQRRHAAAPTSRSLGSVAFSTSALVVATRDGHLFGLDVDTGLTLWSFSLGHPIVATPIIARGWLYTSTTDGLIIALHLADPTLDGWHMYGGNPSHSGLVPAPTARPVPL